MKKLTFFLLLAFPFIIFGQLSSSIDIVGGIDFTYRTLNYSGDENGPEVVLVSRKKEKGKLNWNAGFNYNRRFSNKIILKSGVRFASLGYYREYEDLRFGDEGENGEYNQDPALPNELKIIDDYLFISIPFIARFSRNKKVFSPFIEAGFAPSIYLNSKQKWIRDNSTEVNFHDDTDRYKFNRFHLVGIISFGTNYNVNPNIQLFAQPIFRYNLTKLVDASIAERLFSVGIEIGLRKGFGNPKREK